MTLISRNKLKNSVNNFITSGLFWEIKRNPDLAVFSISDPPRKDLVDFRKVYLEHCVDDPTEYNFAIAVFGSWDHWVEIQANKYVRNYLAKIRAERDIAIESKAVKKIMEEAESGRNSFQAAKFLVQKGYMTKEELDKKRKRRTRVESDIDEDLKRLKSG